MADVYCITCKKTMSSFGIARHRAMHKDRKEDCEIVFSDSTVKKYNYSKDDNCGGL